MSAEPANIIFVMADQLAAGFIGCYGSGVDSTPTLDRLAARGVRFERCYATSPVCAPNRANIATGRSPQVHGIISNNFLLPPHNPTYAHVLRHHGYRVGGFGKFHLAPMPQAHPEDLDYLGFDESVITEDPKWGAYIEWIRSEHPEHYESALAMAWGNPRRLPEEPDPRLEPERLGEIRRRILAPRREASPWHMFYTSPLPAELHQTAYITDVSLDFLRRHVRECPEKPFFCHLSYVDPHDPYDPPEPYAQMYDPADMPDAVPATWTERGNAVLEQAGRWLGFDRVADNPDIVRRLRAKYHGSVRFIDDQIARIVGFLDKADLWDDTVLVFTTDHGDMMGDHRLIAKGRMPYDKCARVPLLVAGKDFTTTTDDSLACALDFFPTFCDWAGVPDEDRPPLEGRSLAPACRGEADQGPDATLVAMGPTESIFTRDGWRLTVFDDPDSPNQLINLRRDPDEQNNLYEDPACAGVRTRLLEQMVELHSRRGRVQQYPVLPIKDGAKMVVGGRGMGGYDRALPLYGPEARRTAREAPVGGSETHPRDEDA